MSDDPKQLAAKKFEQMMSTFRELIRDAHNALRPDASDDEREAMYKALTTYLKLADKK